MAAHRLRLAAGGLLAAALLGFFFHGIDAGKLLAALQAARPLPLVAVVCATIAADLLRAWRWGDFLDPLGRPKFADLFRAFVLGVGAGMLIPRSGELLRPWLVSRRYPIPTPTGFAVIVIERLVDLLVVLVLFAAYVLVLPRPAAHIEGRVADATTVVGVAAGVAAIGLLALLAALHTHARRVLAALAAFGARVPRWAGRLVGDLVAAFSDGLAVLRAPWPHLARIMLQSFAVWFMIAFGFHLNNLAFGIELPFYATFMLVAFLVVGVAIPTPGAVGGFHAFYLLALSEVYGIEPETAAAAAISAHVLINVPALLLSPPLLAREGVSFRGAVGAAWRQQPDRTRR